ncbi:MAG: hypothetical protein QW279_00185 [Candidatus Jordarchaeaceae archaeon]
MLPTAHVLSGIIIFLAFNFFSILPRQFPSLVIILIISINPVFDFLVSHFHSNLITHTPFFWGIIIILILSINQNFWIIVPPLMCHFFLDTIDYGVMLMFPYSTEKFGLRILDRKRKNRSNTTAYLREYLKNRKMQCCELTIMIIAVTVWTLHTI